MKLIRLSPNLINILENNLHIMHYNTNSSQVFHKLPIALLPEIFRDKTYDFNKITMIFFAGFRQNPNNRLILKIIDNYLKQQEKYNILQVDWSKTSAKQSYVSVISKNFKKVGDIIANGLTVFPIDTRIHFVGHSLGAHMAGYVSRSMPRKVERITGLDPAGPFFHMIMPHLKSGDANIVINLHTDNLVYGSIRALADIDFYANAGFRRQPGCRGKTIPFSLSKMDLCSHQRSLSIWAHAVENENLFWAAKRCRFGFDLDDVVCFGPFTSGGTGKYYFNTSGHPPYGLGMEGLKTLKKSKRTKKK